MKLIERDWGYACIEKDCVWIPFVRGRLSKILREIYEETGMTRMIFSAIVNPRQFKKHLKNITREWDEWHERCEDYSHCIEIKYIPVKEAK